MLEESLPDNRICIGWPKPIGVVLAADALNDPFTGVILSGSGVTWLATTANDWLASTLPKNGEYLSSRA